MNKLLLLTTLTRSLDKYHTKNNLSHLISSVFYLEMEMENLNLNLLRLSKYYQNKFSYFVVVEPLNDQDIQSLVAGDEIYNEPNFKIFHGNIIIFEVNMLWLLTSYINSPY